MAINLSEALAQPIVDKRIDILRRIGQFGSISEAARSAGVSYKAAWQAVETLTALAGETLVRKAVGGTEGGGAELTEAGKKVLSAASALQQSRMQVISEFESGQAFSQVALASAAFRLSARNIIPGKIVGMHGGKSQVKAEIQIAPESVIKTSITIESAQLLELAVGKEVLAIFKATAAEVFEQRPDDENKYVVEGEVVHLPHGKRGGEVSVRLSNGIVLVGFARGQNHLKIGSKAYVTILQNNIIIGLTS